MSWRAHLDSLKHNLFQRDCLEADLDEELRSYVELLTEEKVRRGMEPEPARREALLEVGGVEQVKEECRDVRGLGWVYALWQDVRYGFRLLRRSPGFTATAVLTLALGIGANTAMFTVIHAVMLKPLPYPAPDELVAIWTVSPPRPNSNSNTPRRTLVAHGEWIESWRGASESFRGAALYRAWRFAVTGDGDAERVSAALVSAEFFETIGVRPLVGRGFTPEETVVGEDQVVILSDDFWKRRFGGDPSVLDTRIQLSGVSHTIIGIMPPNFQLILPSIPSQPELYAPISAQKRASAGGWSIGHTVARLHNNIGPDAARDELDVIYEDLGEHRANWAGRSADVTRISDELAKEVRPTLLVLLGATACVLLIACVNLTNLLLTRGMTRRKELGVRAVLGAGQSRLVRQLVTESLAIALVGGAGGLIMSHWAVRLIVSLNPSELPRTADLSPEPLVFGFSFLVALVTGLLVSIAPAVYLSRPEIGQAIKEGSIQSGGSRQGNRLRSCLAATEIALAIVLFASAGLLLRSFLELTGVNPQFRQNNLVIVDLVLPEPAYSDDQAQVLFVDRLLESVGAIPGVLSAGITNSLPLIPTFTTHHTFAVAGQPAPEDPPKVGVRAVTPDFLRSMGTALVDGRLLNSTDASRDDVLLVNETFARTYLDSSTPLGSQVEVAEKVRTVVGVVADVKNRNLDAASEPEMYLPFRALPAPFLGLAIHTEAGSEALVNLLRTELRKLDPTIPLGEIQTVEQVLSSVVARPRFHTVLVGAFAALALLLALVGVYGIISYGVVLRRHEIGLRMALGAQRADVGRLIVLRGLAAPCIGIGLGLAGALAVTPLLRSFLFGIEPNDPATYACVATVTLTVVVAASVIPAVRAMRIDPMAMLRHD